MIFTRFSRITLSCTQTRRRARGGGTLKGPPANNLTGAGGGDRWRVAEKIRKTSRYCLYDSILLPAVLGYGQYQTFRCSLKFYTKKINFCIGFCKKYIFKRAHDKRVLKTLVNNQWSGVWAIF